MHKGADVNHLYLGLAMPLGVTIDVLGNEYNVALGNVELLTEIYVRAAPLYYDSKARFSFITVAAAEVIFIEGVP
jgi:hypothetical protein